MKKLIEQIKKELKTLKLEKLSIEELERLYFVIRNAKYSIKENK